MKIVPHDVSKDGKLSLKTDGELKVFFIGVGSAFAIKNNQTNVLLIQGDKHVMVDFGMTGPRALLETAGLKTTDIDTYLITHSHADHIGGLECAALTNRYVGQKFLGKQKTKMIINETYQEILWDRSLRGGMEWNEEEQTNHKRLCFADFFDVIRPKWVTNQPREIYSVDYGDMHIELFRTKHVPDSALGWYDSFTSFGLYVNNKVFISMDTRFDPDLLDLYIDKSEVMFHDVQFFPGAVHAPLSDLKSYFENKPMKKNVYLKHYSDDFEKQDISGFAGWTKQGVSYVF